MNNNDNKVSEVQNKKHRNKFEYVKLMTTFMPYVVI